jgi:signal transduction histidine kinase
VQRSGWDEFLWRNGTRWALYVGIWTVLGLIEAVQSFFLAEMVERKLQFDELLALSLLMWYSLGALAPILVWLARRWPFERHGWTAPLTVLLAASIALAMLKVAIDVPVERWIRPGWPLIRRHSNIELFQIFFNARFMFYLLVFWLVLGLSQALDFYHKYRERELHASLLEAQLAVAQLQVLKMQLQPHFLFNTLNAISALIHRDVDLADRVIARLGELLRTTLDHAGTQEVTLRQELDFIEPYLEIEKARLGPRLTVRIEVEPEVMDALVPNLVLQPLVENAVRHGIAPHAGPGAIEVRAVRDGGLLKLTVRDNGRGLSSNYTEGVGVANTRARLRQLYGHEQHFVLQNHPEGGLLVTVALPFREQPEDPMPRHMPSGVRSQESGIRAEARSASEGFFLNPDP